MTPTETSSISAVGVVGRSIVLIFFFCRERGSGFLLLKETEKGRRDLIN